MCATFESYCHDGVLRVCGCHNTAGRKRQLPSIHEHQYINEIKCIEDTSSRTLGMGVSVTTGTSCKPSTKMVPYWLQILDFRAGIVGAARKHFQVSRYVANIYLAVPNM